MSNSDDQPKQLMLQVSRSDTQARFENQIKQGRSILDTKIASHTGLESAKNRFKKWHDYNKQLLRIMANTEELYAEYMEPIVLPEIKIATGFNKDTDLFRYELRERIRRLDSIHLRLELLPEVASTNDPSKDSVAPQPTVNRKIGNRVFIVHGHDQEIKHSVARCVERLGLEAIILQEQSEQGRTIIEKFEDYADVDFAVVLLTPDDVGASQKDPTALQPRARQNVILELGFFIGKLGRKHVCALYKGDIERPSDVAGSLWIQIDDHDAWQLKLAREMKQAGLDIDVNKLFG